MKKIVLIGAYFLAACSSAPLPFEKVDPISAPGQSLIAPPWEALVKAGPGAEKDIDLETLNGTPAVAAQPALAAVAPAAPKPGATAINAVAILPVAGAPELSAALSKILKDAGWPVLKTPRKDALTIQGKALLDAPQGATQAVHLDWEVRSPDGKVLGDVAQSNMIPAGSLAHGWGENAMPAAQGGADGIFKLISKYR